MNLVLVLLNLSLVIVKKSYFWQLSHLCLKRICVIIIDNHPGDISVTWIKVVCLDSHLMFQFIAFWSLQIKGLNYNKNSTLEKSSAHILKTLEN